jgi:predicted Rossmann fold flavoprotein
MIPPAPSLFTFNVNHPLLKDMAGTAFLTVKAKLNVNEEKPFLQEGPLLMTHWGFSGPVILRLSAWAARALCEAHYQAELIVDFLPALNEEKMIQIFHESKIMHAKKQLGSVVPFEMSRRFWLKIIDTAHLPADLLWTYLSKVQIHALCELLKRSSFQVTGKGPFKEEFVTAGGVSLKEVDFKTMQSRIVPGLFLAGEILDIDGLTGGFNFQNAWSTGWIAGEGLIKNRD